MTRKIKSVLVAIVAIGALAGGSAAIAGAQSGSESTPPEASATPPASEQAAENGTRENESSENESAEQVTGTEADRAVQAALDAVGGGKVLGVENADDGDSGFEVEIEQTDGSYVEVNLDQNLEVVSQGTDD